MGIVVSEAAAIVVALFVAAWQRRWQTRRAFAILPLPNDQVRPNDAARTMCLGTPRIGPVSCLD
jgi:hypothetical protein